jgi:hypothetical protein
MLLSTPKLSFLVLLLLSISGCVTGNVNVHESPSEDSEYYEILEDSTKDETVYKNFETRFTVKATYLSPKFRTAFSKRLEKVFMQGSLKFDHERTKAGFFISIYSPDSDRMDLHNDQHWTVLLGSDQGDLKPVLIKKLNDKERWRAFFDGISHWTTEYLVVFDAPNVTPNSPDLVEKTSIKLTFANADGKVKLTW